MSIFQNITKLTKEQLLEEKPFLHTDHAQGSYLKLFKNEPGDTGSRSLAYLKKSYPNEEWCYLANVYKVDSKGFYWFTTFLGKSIKGKCLFENCIPRKEEQE